MLESSAFSSRKKKITYLHLSHDVSGSCGLSNLAVKFIIAISGLSAVRDNNIIIILYYYPLTIMIQVVLNGG
jgi:hypothetical protein